MKKKIIGLLLCALLLAGAVFGATFSAAAEENSQTAIFFRNSPICKLLHFLPLDCFAPFPRRIFVTVHAPCK